LRQRVERAFARVIDVAGINDAEAAAMIRRLEIDIAVDLMGYTNGSRTSILALRPVPIQVNYLGYPATMGADFIDYIIADSTTIPKDDFAFYSEKVVWLPDTFQVNDRKRAIADATPSRHDCGLPEGGFVFCCFNNSYKIRPAEFDIWMRLLKSIDGSVLWLREQHPSTTANLQREAERCGVAAGRLIFAPRAQGMADHLARLRLADLFLDTLPYNAHTTASDALWAGLPVLTCRGATFAGRVAASVLQAVGLPELIASSPAEYEEQALRLARDPVALAALKSKLLRNRDTYPLFDTDRFTRHIEAAYRAMYERLQRGEPPRPIAIDAVDG
jgi:predicted O-linked N-acetylglucosamine transferase (SPINDLY family)